MFRPWLTTSLFPQLPPRTRTQFRTGLIIVAIAAVGFSVLRLQVPVVAVSVFGLPILFAAYLREIDVPGGPARRLLVFAALLAVGLGIAWALIAGPIVADAYKVVLGGRVGLRQFLLCGVAIPATYGLAMVTPGAVVRMASRTQREALDGFIVGAVGATVVNASATATLLAPQLAMGVTAEGQTIGGLLAEALVEGVAWPLGSVATGGVFGIALWFIPKVGVPRRYRRTLLVPATLLGVIAFAVAMGTVDVIPLPLSAYVALQLLIAVSAVLAVRVVIADALFYEATEFDEATAEAGAQQMRCAECDHVVAAMRFCSDCGVATRAVSPTSRAMLRVLPGGPPDVQAPARPRSAAAVLGPVIGGLGAAVAAAVLIAILIKPAPPAYACPPDCGGPPTGQPVETNPRFSGDNGAFSVAYPGDNPYYEVTLNPPGINGVQLKYLKGDTGMLTLFGEPAGDRTAKLIVQEVLKTSYPTATVDYEIPNASVGYEPGYGVVADVYPRNTSSTYNRVRVIVMAAIRHGYALIATAAGPYHQFSPEYGSGHPSGANLEVAMDMAKYSNSFRWFGDRFGRP